MSEDNRASNIKSTDYVEGKSGWIINVSTGYFKLYGGRKGESVVGHDTGARYTSGKSQGQREAEAVASCVLNQAFVVDGDNLHVRGLGVPLPSINNEIRVSVEGGSEELSAHIDRLVRESYAKVEKEVEDRRRESVQAAFGTTDAGEIIDKLGATIGATKLAQDLLAPVAAIGKVKIGKKRVRKVLREDLVIQCRPGGTIWNAIHQR